MDYEFRIKQAELELAHLRQLQQLHRGRMDAQESSLTSLHTIVERTAVNLDALTIQVGKLTEQHAKLESRIDQLVDALLHGKGRNGDHGP